MGVVLTMYRVKRSGFALCPRTAWLRKTRKSQKKGDFFSVDGGAYSSLGGNPRISRARVCTHCAGAHDGRPSSGRPSCTTRGGHAPPLNGSAGVIRSGTAGLSPLKGVAAPLQYPNRTSGSIDDAIDGGTPLTGPRRAVVSAKACPAPTDRPVAQRRTVSFCMPVKRMRM